MSFLPPDPSILTHEELLDRFNELALRVFNSENALSQAVAVVRQQDGMLAGLRCACRACQQKDSIIADYRARVGVSEQSEHPEWWIEFIKEVTAKRDKEMCAKILMMMKKGE